MKLWKALFNRMTFMVVMVLMEMMMLLFALRLFGEHFGWIEGVLRILSLGIVFYIINHSERLSYDLMWIVVIMLFPVFGSGLYLLLDANLLTSPVYRALNRATERARREYPQNEKVFAKAAARLPAYQGQMHYIQKASGFPVYENVRCDYFGLGEKGFPYMLKALKEAKEFIFLEYFIITEGVMWNSILEILKQKAAEGLEVRVMYDDLGSFTTLSWHYARKLAAFGIKCVPFNRVNPILSTIMNHRDHRKMMIIDGKVAFSGGVNLADEYINLKARFGHWKDNVIRIIGPAVWSYTVMFLTHWNAIRKEDNDFSVFRRDAPAEGESDGIIAPYGETPLDRENTSQRIYLNILNQCKHYCYIFTPYLIVDQDVLNALILAAKRGVDVKIITPGIPDKKLVWRITRSYYGKLLRGGVKIFEYSRGFVHSKVFVADDQVATVGTVNLDFRSLYLHFENGTYLLDAKAVMDIKRDFLDTLLLSSPASEQDGKSGVLVFILRLFAPLM